VKVYRVKFQGLTATNIENLRFFGGMTILIMFFWVKSPCGLVEKSRRFEEADWSYFSPFRWRQHVSPKRWLLLTTPHCDLTQRNIVTNTENVTPYNPVNTDRRLGGAYCLHHQGDDTCQCLLDYVAQHPRRQSSSSTSLAGLGVQCHTQILHY
jgi:hypothetical protein